MVKTRLPSMPTVIFVFVISSLLPINRASETPNTQRHRNPTEPLSIVTKRNSLRRPVALALDERDHRLYVANAQSGSITMIDTLQRKQLLEVVIGGRLSDLEIIPNRPFLIATDEQNHEAILIPKNVFQKSNQAIALVPEERILRIPVAPYPVSISTRNDGTQAYIASLWSRKISTIPIPGESTGSDLKTSSVQTLNLPFSPRLQLLIDNQKRLLVSDAFGGDMAIVDLESDDLQRVFSIPAHNIRGLALSHDGKRVLVSHMILNQLAETSRQSVFWGVVMTNNHRDLSLTTLLSPDTQPLKDSHVHFLGDPGRATGNPYTVAVCKDGTVLVCLGGVNESAIGERLPYSFHRTPVGRRPVDLAIAENGKVAYIANMFSDSISIVNIAKLDTQLEIALGVVPSDLTAVEQGELLFYDANLSLDGWYSCHSCHTDGHTNGLLVDNLGDESFGSPKRVLTLLGVRNTAPWAWNGKIEKLSTQTQKSIIATMQGKTPDPKQVQALTAYLQQLPPPPTDAHTLPEQTVEKGRLIFHSHGCSRCHRSPTFTSPGRYDVGLVDHLGLRRYSPPSLRGVGYGRLFFHDNQATSLRNIFVKHRHGLVDPLTEQELDDLLTFLHSL